MAGRQDEDISGRRAAAKKLAWLLGAVALAVYATFIYLSWGP